MSDHNTVTEKGSALSPAKNVSVPVQVLIFDDQYSILYSTGEHNILGRLLPAHPVGLTVRKLLHSLLSHTEITEFDLFISSVSQGRFCKSIKTQKAYGKNLILSVYPPYKESKDRQWLMVVQDVTGVSQSFARLTSLENELETIKRTEKRELDKMTISLIETNVALRREIRDRQNTLEKLSESEARFRDLTETTSDFIWEINTSGNYTYASPKCFKLLGLQPEELLGTRLFLLRKVESASIFIKNIEFVGKPQQGFAKMEYSHTRQDGYEVTVESSGEPVFSKNKRFTGFRGIDRDVTERRIYETQLRLAKEAAEAANSAKSEFLANMSHELRTPLHAILSYAMYGEKRIDSANRNEILRFFKQITFSAQRLLPLIDNLLDLAKLESGKNLYDFQQLDLIIEIRSAIHEITPLAEKKGLLIKFTSESVATVAWFDRLTVAQVVRNLLANAVKFSDSNTVITISFETDQDNDGTRYLETQMANYGVGIPADELDNIFNKFTQSSRTRSGAGGTGLGLSICKKIIDDHGGRIWASQVSTGETRFHFTLPTAAPDNKREKHLRPSHPSSGKR